MNALKTLALASGMALSLGAATPAQAHDHHWRGHNQHHYVYSRHYARPYSYSYYRPAYVYGNPYYYDNYSYPRYYAGPQFGLTFAFGGHHSRHHHHHW